MNIYIVRHGETDENRKGNFYGSTNIDLNDEGINQGKILSKELKLVDFDYVFISESKRVIHMADIILNNKISNIITDKRLNEIDFGLFEGKNYKELCKLFPKECESWNNNWKEFQPPKGESYIHFYNRVSAFMDDILKYSCENILIVTHSGVIKSIYCYILDQNIDLFWRFSSKNGDVSIIKYEYEYLFIDSIKHIK